MNTETLIKAKELDIKRATLESKISELTNVVEKIEAAQFNPAMMLQIDSTRLYFDKKEAAKLIQPLITELEVELEKVKMEFMKL